MKPEAVVKDQSKRGITKPKLKPEVRVCKLEALVQVGILDFDATVDCKCQEQNSISKELSRGASLIEYSRRIFGLSWFQLTGLLEKFVDYIMVENRTQQPETASELLPDLKK